MTKEDRRIILSCFANGFEFRKSLESVKVAEVKTLCGAEVFTVDYMNSLAEILTSALDKQEHTCLHCARWKAFADAMECTRCHEERSSDEYCSKWEAKQ